MPGRLRLYAANALNLLLLGAITFFIDKTHGAIGTAALTRPPATGPLAAWSAAVTAACLLLSVLMLSLRRRSGRLPSNQVLHLLPRTAVERVLFVLLSVLIGVAEEYLYRGFALLTLEEYLHSSLLSVLVMTTSFALIHGIQDALAILRAFVLGLFLAVPVLALGSVLPSIIAHALTDAHAGLFMRKLLRLPDAHLGAPKARENS